MGKKYDIFISYRRNGGETTAVLLKSELSHLGYNVFLDYDDLPIGGGVEVDMDEAKRWYNIAANQGYKPAINMLKNE